MRSLVVAALMLSSMALSALGAGPQAYCSAGSRILTDRTIQMVDDLTSYNGVTCESDPKVKLVLDASKAPDGFGITATFTDGTIGAGGALQFIGPTGDRIGMVAPLLVRIERCIFEKDAVLHVQGSLPTSSLISISGNRFDVGAPHEVLRNINTNFISAITFGNYETEMVLGTNAQVTCYENNLHVEDATGDAQPYETYGIFASSHFYLGNDAGFLIQRNNITAKTVANNFKAVGVYCPRYVFMIGNTTLTQIQGNTMELTNGIMFHSPSVAVSENCHGNADFSQNTATLLPVHESTYGAIIGPVNLTTTSTVEIADNVIVNRNDGAISNSVRMFMNGPAHLRDQSGLYLWFNTMNTQGGSPQITFGGPSRTEGEGKIMVVGNQMERMDGLTLGLSPLQWFSLIMEGSSSVTVSQNKFGATNGNNKPFFMTASTSVDAPANAKGVNATFDVCHNLWYGSEFASQTALLDSIPNANLKVMISDIAECPATITTTTLAPRTTTTRTTRSPGTTVPADNGAPVATQAVAGAALLAAIVACLL